MPAWRRLRCVSGWTRHFHRRGYGQDDRVCAFIPEAGPHDIPQLEKTIVCMLLTKKRS